MRRTAAPALLALALLLGATACSDDSAAPTVAADAPTPSRPAGDGPTTSADEPDASSPPFPADPRPDDGGQGSGNGLGLTGVRMARHSDFDRVVFDLGGTGTPGWRVEYVERPVAEGSGEPVALEGTVYLQVVLRGLGLPFDTGLEPFGDSTTRVPGSGTEGVAEVAPGGVFEGEQQAFIGLTGDQRPFRAFALTDPARLVVDVQHG